MSLRILIAADVLPDPSSGAAGTDYLGALALKRLGHEVDCIWADELPRKIRHYNARYLLELPVGYRNAVLHRLRSRVYDIIQVSQPYGYLAAKLVRAKYPNSRFVHRTHGLEARVNHELVGWSRRFAPSRPWHRAALSNCMCALLEYSNRAIALHAHGHLVSAAQCGGFLQSNYDVNEERIAVIPQAIPDCFADSATFVDSNRILKLLHVGQYAFVKGDIILGRAVSRLLENNLHARFTWVCSEQHHADAIQLFSEQVRPRVNLVASVTQEKLRDIYDAHGVFLFPSFFEGFGKAFLEAMARGLVVVASDEGGMRDIVVDGANGFKCQKGATEEIVARVHSIWRDVPSAIEMSRRAIQTAQPLTWDQFALSSTRFYHRLLQVPGGGYTE